MTLFIIIYASLALLTFMGLILSDKCEKTYTTLGDLFIYLFSGILWPAVWLMYICYMLQDNFDKIIFDFRTKKKE